MKIYFFILISFFLINSIFAQEFEVHFSDSVGYGQPESVFTVEGHITNLSSTNTITIKMIRIQNNLPSQNWTSSLCFGSCYPSFVDSITYDILPNASEIYSVDFFSDSIPATASVLIKFATLHDSQIETQWFIGTTITTGIDDDYSNSIKSFKLLDNYPNPFNNQTIISAQFDKVSSVTLHIYDILGREVYNEQKKVIQTGKVMFRWSGINNYGEELSSGIYFYRITTNSTSNIELSQIKKLTLLR